MRRWNKLSVIVALLSVILIVSVVFSSGAIDVLTLSLESPPATAGAPESSSPEVFVDPSATIKDYENDPGYQIGDTFQVHVNITDAINLFSWQINMSWNTLMFNLSNIIASEFLNRTNPTANTTSHELGYVINKADNVTGYTAPMESILGGDTGVNGSGRLVTVEFLVTGYGCSNLTLSISGILPTTLLNSTIDSMTFTMTDGYFKNKLSGDCSGDGYVNSLDNGKVNGHWAPAGGAPEWSLGYNRCVDNNDDGYINSLDDGVVNGNWGRNIFD